MHYINSNFVLNFFYYVNSEEFNRSCQINLFSKVEVLFLFRLSLQLSFVHRYISLTFQNELLASFRPFIRVSISQS